jgi:predicted nucleic acid-binding protein
MGYLLDSNVLIDYVAERFSPHQLQRLDAIVDDTLVISVVTKIEVLGFNGDITEMAKMAAFVQMATVLPLSDDVVLQTIALRKVRRMKMPDAIIAATTLVHKLTLLSRNLADFRNISGLTTLDPHDW